MSELCKVCCGVALMAFLAVGLPLLGAMFEHEKTELQRDGVNAIESAIPVDDQPLDASQIESPLLAGDQFAKAREPHAQKACDPSESCIWPFRRRRCRDVEQTDLACRFLRRRRCDVEPQTLASLLPSPLLQV